MTKRQNRTDRQREVLGFIEAKIARDGYPPTIREIGEHLGIRPTNGVTDHLKALQRKGVLTRAESKSRACVPLHPSQPPAPPPPRPPASQSKRPGKAQARPGGGHPRGPGASEWAVPPAV